MYTPWAEAGRGCDDRLCDVPSTDRRRRAPGRPNGLDKLRVLVVVVPSGVSIIPSGVVMLPTPGTLELETHSSLKS